MNLMNRPSPVMPITASIIPARIVAVISPAGPCWSMTPKMMITNAPVGPPIWNLLPPKRLTQNPAVMAV